MEDQKIAPLLEIAQAVLIKDQANMHAIVAEESRLRLQIQRLTEQEIESRTLLSETQGMQLVGADIVWRAWLSKKRSELNLELARVLARKKPMEDAIRQSFGRATALEQLQKVSLEKRAKDRAQKRYLALLDTA